MPSTGSKHSEALLSPLASLQRLSRVVAAGLDALGQSDADTPSEQPPALLFIGGVDSRDDEANAAVLNYLFTTQTDASGSADEAILHPSLEDTVLLVHRAGVHLYIAPSAALTVAEVTQWWPNLTVTMLPAPANLVDDADGISRFEQHKLESFREIVARHRRIGMVYSRRHYGSDAQPLRVVEKWPLVQSFAFDPAGARPFFTQAKHTVNVTDAVLGSLFVVGGQQSTVDRAPGLDADAALLGLLTQSATLVAAQVESTLSWVDGRVRRGTNLAEVSSKEANDAFSATLVQFAEHCRMGALPDALRIGDATTDVDVDVRRADAVVRIRFTHPTKPLAIARTFALLESSDRRGAHTLESARVASLQLPRLVRRFVRTAAGQVALAPSTSGEDRTNSWAAFVAEQGWKGTEALVLSTFTDRCPAGSSTNATTSNGQSAAMVFFGIESLRGAMLVGDSFLVVGGNDASFVCANATSCVPYVEGVLRAPLTTSIFQAVTASLEEPPSRRTAVGGVGKIIVDVSRADGAAVLIGGATDLGTPSAIAASVHALGGRTATTVSGGGSAVFCETGLFLTHSRYGLLGPAPLSDLAVHNPPDTTTPISIVWQVPASTEAWYSGLVVVVALRESSFARREFLSSLWPRWKTGTAAIAAVQSSESASADAADIFVPDRLRDSLLHTTSQSPSLGLLVSRLPDPFAATHNKAATRDAFAMSGLSSTVEDEDPESAARRSNRDLRRELASALPELQMAAAALHLPTQDELPEQPSTTSRGTVDVYLVGGQIGSGKHRVASALARALQAEAAAIRKEDEEAGGGGASVVEWQQPDVEHCLSWSTAHFADDLRTWRKEAQQSAGLLHAVVLLPPTAALPDVFAAVASVGGCRIAASVAVVSPDAFFLEANGRDTVAVAPGPLAWRSLLPGFVSTICVLGPRLRVAGSPTVARVERAIRHAYSSLTQALLWARRWRTGAEAAIDALSKLSAQEQGTALTDPLLQREDVHVVSTIDDVLRRSVLRRGAASCFTTSERLMLARQVLVTASHGATSYDDSARCAEAQTFLPQVVTFRFPRLPLIEPDVFDFMGHVSDTVTAASIGASPFCAVFRTKASLFIEGRPMELIAVRHKPQQNRLRKRTEMDRGSNDMLLRTDQVFHFFLPFAVAAESREAMQRHVLRRVAFRGSLVGDVLLPRETAEEREGTPLNPHTELRPLLARDDLTAADLERLGMEAARKGEPPLPENWYEESPDVYRNAQTNNAVKGRPDIENLAQAFLDRHNAAAKRFNDTVLAAKGTQA